MLSFSIVVTDALRRLGFRLSESEVEAWFHLWRVVGFLLGVPERWLPENAAEGARRMEQLRALYWGPSEAGAALADATLALMREWLPHKTLDGAPASLVRHLAGERCADLLGLPMSDWTGLAVARAARVFGATAAHLFADQTEPVIGAGLAQRTMLSAMKALTSANLQGRPAHFGVPRVLRGAAGYGPHPTGEV
jgi:hypothetical protein